MLRKIMMIFSFIGVMFVYCISTIASTGTYAMSFTGLISNPYTASLANTVTAANNSNAVFINPASLGHKEYRQISAQLFKYIDNIEYKQFQIIQPYFKGSMALSYTWLNYGTYQQTTWTDKEGETTDAITNMGRLLHITYARQVLNTNFGISAKVMEEVLASYKARTVSVDLGLQKAIKENVILGMSISNMSINKVTFINDSAYLRKSARMGIQYEPLVFKNRLTLLTDYSYLQDKSILSYATVITLHPKLSIRLGSNQFSDLFNLSLGVGINLESFNIDMSYKNVADFSDVYRIQVGVRF